MIRITNLSVKSNKNEINPRQINKNKANHIVNEFDSLDESNFVLKGITFYVILPTLTM